MVGEDIFANELEYVGVAVLINVQVPDAGCLSLPRTARKEASETGSRMSSARNLEMREVERGPGAANAAVTREEWAEAGGSRAGRGGNSCRRIA